MRVVCTFIFFFKQKTADEMRISDWSSDVCSSDLPLHPVKQAWRVQQDLRRPFGQAREARPVDDRRDPSQGASDGSQPAQKGAVPRRIGRNKGGLNSKLHAFCDGKGRPLVMLLSAGQLSEYKGAALIHATLPKDQAHTGDRSSHPDR